jgi:neutral ceramidase
LHTVVNTDKYLLAAGTAVADITPPLEVGLLTSSVKALYEPFRSVRLPLKARVLVLRGGGEVVAIVALDLLCLSDTSVGGWQNFKKSLSGIIPPEKIILTCTHTHNAPESGALSDLYLEPVFTEWMQEVRQKIKLAITQAISSLRSCSLTIASEKLQKFSMQRRIPTDKGIIMSDSIQPIADELMGREPVDHRVRAIGLHDVTGAAIATVVHAVCHPVHEMCMPHVSAEFPGEMCLALEEAENSGTAFFLNGAAGDTNPPTVSCGPEYAKQHGIALAKLVQGYKAKTVLDTEGFKTAHTEIKLKARPEAYVLNEQDAVVRLNTLCIGPLAIVFLPGEPFLGIALEIEKYSPFEHTIVVGYAENSVGYIPTTEEFEKGGYEASPGRWSFLHAGADKIVIAGALQLLNDLNNKDAVHHDYYAKQKN